MLLAVFFLGTAIPALLFGALLAFGVILDNSSPVLQLIFIVWVLVLTQSLIFALFKQAVLGSRYTLFLVAHEATNKTRYLCDCGLALLCNPVILLLLLTLGCISPVDWSSIPQGFLLLYMLGLSMFFSMYKPMANNIFLGLSLLIIPLLNGLSLNLALTILCVCQLAIGLLYRFVANLRFSISEVLPVAMSFWLLLTQGSQGEINKRSGQRHNRLFIAIIIAALFIVITHYCASQLPQFAFAVHLIGVQFVVLASASIQLSINKTVKQYPLFFELYNTQPSFRILQFWVSSAVSVIMLGIAVFVFNAPLIMFNLLVALICIIVAKRSSRLFIISWLSTGLLMSVLLFKLHNA
jgi:hypothetical protein